MGTEGACLGHVLRYERLFGRRAGVDSSLLATAIHGKLGPCIEVFSKSALELCHCDFALCCLSEVVDSVGERMVGHALEVSCFRLTASHNIIHDMLCEVEELIGSR